MSPSCERKRAAPARAAAGPACLPSARCDDRNVLARPRPFCRAVVQRQCQQGSTRERALCTGAAVVHLRVDEESAIVRPAFTPHVWRKCPVPHFCHTRPLARDTRSGASAVAIKTSTQSGGEARRSLEPEQPIDLHHKRLVAKPRIPRPARVALV